MNGREKILFDRVAFCVFVGILVVFLGVLFRILATDADYKPIAEPVLKSSEEILCDAESAMTEPSDSYLASTLTFGGACTTASMLGSSSYGTFNLMYSENGAQFFFGELGHIFASDDVTIVGCSGVLSDNKELDPAEKDVTEWYRAPSSAAEIYSSCGIDAVSLECSRALDYGWQGRADTEVAFAAVSVSSGTADKDIIFGMEDGVEGVVLCEAYYEGCEEKVRERIGRAKADYGFVVLYITDKDDSYAVSDTKRDAYRSFVDSGADLIVGTNGSKLQYAERWNGKTIAYSLGTLIDGSAKYSEKYTALLRVTVKIDRGTVVGTDCEFIPVETFNETYSWRPRLLKDGAEHDAVVSFIAGERDVPNV